MKRLFIILVAAFVVLSGAGFEIARQVEAQSYSAGEYTPPDGAVVTYFAAPQPEHGPPLVAAGSIEAGFMRPFLLSFQRHNPGISIAYIQTRNDALLNRALEACKRHERTADIYLTSSTDHLVRLANENCAADLPSAIGEAAPARASWRNEVVAFTVEPAVFVFSRNARRPLPSSHIELLYWLRGLPKGNRIGTYDIEASADGYDLAASDSRQDALYGRLLEALGRSDNRLYCCSNVMVDAVDRREIVFAYNVQLSYAYTAQRAGSRITVVLPDDYQALQTLSFMLPKHSRDSGSALKLAQFLVSHEARAIAHNNLVPPRTSSRHAIVHANELLAQASVAPTLLRLQDRARRAHLISEWREAIGPVGSGTRQTASYDP